MAAFSTIATASMMGLSAASAYQQAGAISAQNEFSKAMTEINIRRANIQKQDALDRGANAADKYRTNVKKLVGSQKVALAAQGIDISSGSAAEIMSQTEELGNADAQTIEMNAFREAMGYGMQATDYRANQIMDNAASQTRRTTTLLGGALGAAKYASEEWGAPTTEKAAPAASGRSSGGYKNKQYPTAGD